MEVQNIDGLNIVSRMVPDGDGEREIQGLTVRALRKVLEKADDDAMVFYIFEADEKQTKIGAIVGVAVAGPLVPLFGSDVARAIKEANGSES